VSSVREMPTSSRPFDRLRGRAGSAGVAGSRTCAPDVEQRAQGGLEGGAAVRPVDVAYAVRFVVSDEGRFVQGSSIDVDGGITGARIS